MKPKMIGIRSCGKTFEMSVRDLTDWQLDRLLEYIADGPAVDPAAIDMSREAEAWRLEASSEHTFTNTNRHLVEVPDSFAVAQPHTDDTAALRQALEIVIKNDCHEVQ